MPEFAHRLDGITGSAIRELFKLLTKGDVISFGGGNPSASSFPVEKIKEIACDALDNHGYDILQYGATEGYARLRLAAKQCFLEARGVHGVPDECILPTTGSIQGMELVSRTYLDPGDTVLIEEPTFLGVLQTLKIAEANLVGVPSDDEGMIMEELEKLMKERKPKLLYCIPTFQNPSGRTLGLERRKRVAELAVKYDVVVAEDDPYYDLRYEGEPLPPIKSFDTSDHVILLNSFSKIMSPGMRVGVVTGPRDAIRKMTIVKQGVDTMTPTLMQSIAAEFLLRGELPNQLERIRPEYAKRLNEMYSAMEKYFPAECAFTKPEGGLFIWADCDRLDMTELAKRAIEEKKTAYIPGVHFYEHKKGHDGTFRLNFSGARFEDLSEGIHRLGDLMKDALEGK